MNASNLIAWLLCLGLAFFASAMSLSNRGEIIVLEKKLQQVQSDRNTSQVQAEVLEEIKNVLTQMQRGAEEGTGTTEKLDAMIDRIGRLEERIKSLEKQVQAGR